MNTQEFKAKLESLVALEDDFSALVFFAMRSGNEVVLKKANMKADVLAGIAEGYRDSLASEIERFNHDEHMAVLNLSDRDERGNVIYRYDIPDVEPSYFSVMKEPVSEPPVVYAGQKMFSFENDSFSDIDYNDSKFRGRVKSAISRSRLEVSVHENSFPNEQYKFFTGMELYEYDIEKMGSYGRWRMIVDFVSSMTDKYAVTLYQQLSGNKI